ncbi:daxx-like protein isoform 2-T4 [Cochliomyia hominivorax]
MQALNSNTLAASFLALNNIINDERQTPTPPRGPQTSVVNQRKRKTPTPPQAMPRLTAKNYATMTNSSPAKAATTVAPLPPIMPMITGVHSMAAGATPPLQLMATPPHNLGAFMGLNEQLMINPHLIPSGLPPNTTITAHPNPNQNNINNNFKIHLPFNKPSTTTPSPAASPASSAPKTPSPQLTPSPQPGRGEKQARRIKPTTILKASDENWQRHKQNDKTVAHRGPISLNNDVVIEMLPPATESPKSTSASSSRHHTPLASPTTPKSQKSPDVIMLTTPTTTTSSSSNTSNESTKAKDYGTILDLTQSPDKHKNSTTEIVDLVDTPKQQQKQQMNGSDNKTKSDKKAEKPPSPKSPLEPEYEELIKVCREADPSKDMEKLIKSKLIKYYYEVHSDFVKSKSFRKNIRKVVETIKAKPDLVYYNLKTIVEELKVRRKARLVAEAAAEEAAANKNNNAESLAIVTNIKTNSDKNTTTNETNNPATTSSSSTNVEISATASTSTGNKKLDEQIKKLNKALYVLTKRIEVLEQAEVDWDDDDSSFLQVERFKKRACQIYEKICDLTGESKNAHRLVKKPIKFNETRIPQFNKTLQAFINRTKEFPDYYDVLRMLEHCNRTYNLGLVNFEMKNIAEDAFIKVGKLLQSRRKADLYETVTHYAGDGKDPAKSDPALAAKLNENLKNHKKISEILEKFARKQDMPDEEEEDKSDKTETENTKDETEEINKDSNSNRMETKTITNCYDNKKQVENKATEVLIKSENQENETKLIEFNKTDVDETVAALAENDNDDDDDDDEEDDEDEEEEDDEEDEVNIDEQVETLANGVVSDNESDTEVVNNNKLDNSIEHTVTTTQTLNESLEIVDKTLDTTTTSTIEVNTSTECIEITDNSQEILKLNDSKENCSDKESSFIQITSESDSLLFKNNNNNNNNINLDITTTKTVINTSLISSPSPPITPASITPTPNGKLKDSNTTTTTTTTKNHLLNDKNDNASIINTATVTTTTTTADLKIVHVSSLEPDKMILDDNNDDVVTSTALLSSTEVIGSKSLDEIVISDEES